MSKKNLQILSLSIAVLILFIITSFCFLDSGIAQQYMNKEHVFFNAHDPNQSSYEYDGNHAQGGYSGEVYTYNYAEKTIQIRIATLNSASIDVRIEGRVEDANSWANVYSKNYASATTIDELVSVSEHLEYLRVGLRANTDSTGDSVTIFANFGVPRQY